MGFLWWAPAGVPALVMVSTLILQKLERALLNPLSPLQNAAGIGHPGTEDPVVSGADDAGATAVRPGAG